MVFVNQVAAIVHRVVDEHLGAANQNVGEAFLLVWRIGAYEKDEAAAKRAQGMRSKLADLSIMSFMQIVSELNRDRQLAVYREHPALLARVPEFRVGLGFGLHSGWSIEGAIGSVFKIEATYLSPHVNLVSKLEAVTTLYRVPILISEPLVRGCTRFFRQHLRPVDHVKLRGSKVPMRIYTIDLDFKILPVNHGHERRRKPTNTMKYKERQEREKLKLDRLQDTYKVWHGFETDKYLRMMRDSFSSDFMQDFETGYVNYEAGEWHIAAEVFKRTRTITSNDGTREWPDGPSCLLLEYIRSFGGAPPPGWPGYREVLVDK